MMSRMDPLREIWVCYLKTQTHRHTELLPPGLRSIAWWSTLDVILSWHNSLATNTDICSLVSYSYMHFLFFFAFFFSHSLCCRTNFKWLIYWIWVHKLCHMQGHINLHMGTRTYPAAPDPRHPLHRIHKASIFFLYARAIAPNSINLLIVKS